MLSPLLFIPHSIYYSFKHSRTTEKQHNNYSTNNFLNTPTLPPISISFPSVITTQHQSHSSKTSPGSTSYDLYASLHPSFHNFPLSLFQPPNLPPNPCPPPQTPTHPFITLNSQPPPPGFPMTPSVPFVATLDPFQLFHDLDHTYPPEKFFAHLSARLTFQLGPHPLDIQSYLTWHSRRMSPLY